VRDCRGNAGVQPLHLADQFLNLFRHVRSSCTDCELIQSRMAVVIVRAVAGSENYRAERQGPTGGCVFPVSRFPYIVPTPRDWYLVIGASPPILAPGRRWDRPRFDRRLGFGRADTLLPCPSTLLTSLAIARKKNQLIAQPHATAIQDADHSMAVNTADFGGGWLCASCMGSLSRDGRTSARWRQGQQGGQRGQSQGAGQTGGGPIGGPVQNGAMAPMDQIPILAAADDVREPR